MADYLSRDHSSNQQGDSSMDAEEVDEEYRLTDREEDVFISVFVASLHLITGRGVHIRGKDKKKQLVCVLGSSFGLFILMYLCLG